MMSAIFSWNLSKVSRDANPSAKDDSRLRRCSGAISSRSPAEALPKLIISAPPLQDQTAGDLRRQASVLTHRSEARIRPKFSDGAGDEERNR